jgi:hypothetical protein
MFNYDTDNVQDLYKKYNFGDNTTIEYLEKSKIAKEIQVHTKGKLFDKIIDVFQNEDPEATRHVLGTYEPFTKNSIWKGIININKILSNTGYEVSGNADVLEQLKKLNFYEDFRNLFINIGVATDPNAIIVWHENKLLALCTKDIVYKDENGVAYIDWENTQYELVKDNHCFDKVNVTVNNNNKLGIHTYTNGYKRQIIGNKTVVYQSKEQIITSIYLAKQVETTIVNRKYPLQSIYANIGIDEDDNGIYHSPAEQFIAFGNYALIQHRTFRAVEAMFGYPRAIEVALPCDEAGCLSGTTDCDPCDDFPLGRKPCSKCKGSGQLDLRSPYKIIKRKLDANHDSLNANIPFVEYITPDIGILQYNATAWRDSLKLAEESMFIKQRQQTGNVESAKSKEIDQEDAYTWYTHIGKYYYSAMKKLIEIAHQINGKTESVGLEPPMSLAVYNEMESFEILNSYLATDTPLFLKQNKISSFISKYTSKSNPIHKVIEVLKLVDIFLFYSQSDIEKMSNNGSINDKDWMVHNYAFPLLQQMISEDNKILDFEPIQIKSLLDVRLNEKIASKPNLVLGNG